MQFCSIHQSDVWIGKIEICQNTWGFCCHMKPNCRWLSIEIHSCFIKVSILFHDEILRHVRRLKNTFGSCFPAAHLCIGTPAQPTTVRSLKFLPTNPAQIQLSLMTSTFWITLMLCWQLFSFPKLSSEKSSTMLCFHSSSQQGHTDVHESHWSIPVRKRHWLSLMHPEKTQELTSEHLLVARLVAD